VNEVHSKRDQAIVMISLVRAHDNRPLRRSKIYHILNKQRSVRFQWLYAPPKGEKMDFQTGYIIMRLPIGRALA
jgi:hypothetical protein